MVRQTGIEQRSHRCVQLIVHASRHRAEVDVEVLDLGGPVAGDARFGATPTVQPALTATVLKGLKAGAPVGSYPNSVPEVCSPATGR